VGPQQFGGQPGDELDGSYFLRVPLRRWPWIVGAVILGLVCALAFARLSHSSYTATATVIVHPVPTSLGGDSVSSAPVNGTNEQAVASSQAVAADAQRILRSSDSTTQLLGRLSAQTVAKSAILTFSYKAPTRVAAAAGANAFADAYLTQRRAVAQGWITQTVRRLQAQLVTANNELQGASNEAAAAAGAAELDPAAVSKLATAQAAVTKLEIQSASLSSTIGNLNVAAVNPGSVSQPALASSVHTIGRSLELAIGGLVGLLVGLIAAFVRERFDDRIRSRGAYSIQLGLLPLAVLGGRRGRRRAREEISTVTSPKGKLSGSYSRLAALLTAGPNRVAGNILAVASPADSQAALTVAANLAAAIARNGSTVSLVSTDPVCRPGERSGLASHPEGHVIGADDTGGATRWIPDATPGLTVVDFGGSAESGYPKVLRSAIMSTASTDDYTVVAGPALAASGDGLFVASCADEVLIVAAAGRDRASQIGVALTQLQSMGVAVSGIVVQGASVHGAQRLKTARRSPAEPRFEESLLDRPVPVPAVGAGPRHPGS
jgi:succinoglycan biosynthesis transport protein ExoP